VAVHHCWLSHSTPDHMKVTSNLSTFTWKATYIGLAIAYPIKILFEFALEGKCKTHFMLVCVNAKTGSHIKVWVGTCCQRGLYPINRLNHRAKLKCSNTSWSQQRCEHHVIPWRYANNVINFGVKSFHESTSSPSSTKDNYPWLFTRLCCFKPWIPWFIIFGFWLLHNPLCSCRLIPWSYPDSPALHIHVINLPEAGNVRKITGSFGIFKGR